VTGPALTAQASWTSLGYAPERQRGGAVTTDISDSLASAMAAAQNGDAGAYRLLLRRCAPVIVDVARTRGFGGAAVDEIVQETLLNFFHPFDVAVIDLTVHGLTVAGIALIGREFGQRFLAGPRFPGGESAGP
jgi:hypothetical protein